MISKIELKNFGKIDDLTIPNLTGKNLYLTGKNGSGKCLDIKTPVLTPNGWVRLADIHTGDTLYDVDGNECKVTAEYPQPDNLDVYRITFSDNCYIDCCKDHQWMYVPHGLKDTYRDWLVGSTTELLKRYEEHNYGDGLAIPVCKPIRYKQETKLPIDPYAMGLLLSIGKMPKAKAVSIVAKDREIVNKLAKCLVKMAIAKQDKNSQTLWWLIDDTTEPIHSLSYILEHIGLRGITMRDRFIPQEYLRANIANRRKLLQGLMDGGGYINNRVGVVFRTQSASMFRDFVELVRSLGYRCTTVKKFREDIRRNEYVVDIQTRDILYTAPRLICTTKKFHKRNAFFGDYDILKIKSIVKLNKAVPMKCITVDSPTNTYIVKNYIATHNTTVLQAISLALTGKVAKGLTIDKYIGPMSDDFSVILTLDDGTKIGRTSKKSKLRLPDGRVYNKTKDVYEQLPFDPLMLYNLSYVKQGEISDLFSSGGKAVIDKLVGMVINSKRLGDGYSTITKRYNTNKSIVDTLNSNVEANASRYNLDEVEDLKRQIEATKARLAKAECKITADEIDRYTRMHNAYKQAKANYEALQSVKVEIPTQPIISEDVAKEKFNRYKLYNQAVEKKKEYETKINELTNLQSYAEPIKQFLALDLRLLRNDFSVEDLKDIETRNNKFRSVLETEDHYDSTQEAYSAFMDFCNNRNVDSQNIIKAKETFEEIRTVLRPIEAKVKELKLNGYTAENFDDRIAKDVDSTTRVLAVIEEQLAQNTETNPMTEDKYYDVCAEWLNYRKALRDKEAYEKRLDEAKTAVDSLAAIIKSTPTEEEIAEMRASYTSKMDIQNNLSSLMRQLNMLESIKDQIVETKTKINDLEDENSRLSYWKDILADAPVRLRQGLFGPVVDNLNKQFYGLFSFGGLGEITLDWSKMQLYVGGKTFEQCSGAQMVALGLSMRLALLQVMGSYIPLMLIDEPTAHLDDDRKNDVKKFLNVISKYSQIVGSTHDDAIVGDNAVVINLGDDRRKTN